MGVEGNIMTVLLMWSLFLQISTRLSLVHYALGIALFNEGIWDEAEGQLSSAIKYNNKVSEYYASRGKVYYFQVSE